MKFPRIIHQIWMQGEEEIPDFGRESAETWKAKNPEFEYMFWDEQKIADLIQDRYPWFYQTWREFPHMMQRIDTGRFAILHAYGGIAADMDSNCIHSVEPLFRKYDDTEKTVLVAEFPYQNPIEHVTFQSLNFSRKLINLGIQVAKPGNDIHLALLKVTKAKADKVKEGVLKPGSKAEEVGQIGGLAMATNVMQYDEYKDELEILPYYSFEAQEAPKKVIEKGEGVYSEHKWKASWLPEWVQKLVEKVGPRPLKYTLYAAIPLLILGVYLLLRRFAGATVAAVAIIGIILEFVTLFSLSSHGAYVSDHKTTQGPLNDRLFDLIPYSEYHDDDWQFLLVYHFPSVLLIATLVYAYFFYKGGDKKMFCTILVAFLAMQGLRQFTIQLTALPPPAVLRDQSVVVSSVQESFKSRDTEPYIEGHSDMIFSGHTVTTLISLLFILYMTGTIDCLWARVFLFFAMAIAIFYFVWIRLHYSVDIFIGVVIALLVFGYARHYYEDKSLRGLEGSRFFTIFKVAVAGALLSLFITLISLQSTCASCTNDTHCGEGSSCINGKCKAI